VGLKFLNLRMNGFSMEGAQAMASALTVNRTLMELDLSANRIPLQGIVSISKGINTNEVLVSLKVRNSEEIRMKQTYKLVKIFEF